MMILKLLYQWVSPWQIPPRWMMFAVYRASRRQSLFVIPPLNCLVVLAWHLQDKWAHAANAPSWIEREVADRIELQKKIEIL